MSNKSNKKKEPIEVESIGQIMQSAGIRANTDAMASAGKSANLSNFLDNLGELGTEKARLKSINDNPFMIYGRDEEGNIYIKKLKKIKLNKKKQIEKKLDKKDLRRIKINY